MKNYNKVFTLFITLTLLLQAFTGCTGGLTDSQNHKNNDAVTSDTNEESPKDSQTDELNEIPYIETNVTAENIVNTINTLQTNTALKVTGEFSHELISQITIALKQLYAASPLIKVRFDLSGTTGLQALLNAASDNDDTSFYGCKNIDSFILPDCITSIGEYAFFGCTALTSITIPSGITIKNFNAFSNCINLTEVYYKGTIEQWISIHKLSNPCFNGAALYIDNKIVVNVTIPDGVTSIDDYAFYGCSGFKSIIIPSSVTSIGDHSFYGCNALESITIPSNVTSIGDFSFGICHELSSITIPSNVTSIGAYAFKHCSGLTSITIPSSVTSIGRAAFSDCYKLTSVSFQNTTGWKDSEGNEVSVSDPAAAAELLKQQVSLTRSN